MGVPERRKCLPTRCPSASWTRLCRFRAVHLYQQASFRPARFHRVSTGLDCSGRMAEEGQQLKLCDEERRQHSLARPIFDQAPLSASLLLSLRLNRGLGVAQHAGKRGVIASNI